MKVIIVALAFAALVATEPRRRVRDLYISEPYRSSSSYLPYRSSLLNRDFDSAEIYSDSYYPSSSYASALYPKSYDFYSKSYDLYPKSYDLYPKSFDSVYPTQYPISQGFYPSRYYQSTPFEGFSKYYPGRFYQPYPLVAKAPYFGDYYTPEVVEPITYIAAPAAPLVAEKVVKEVIVEKEPELTYTRKPSYSLVQKEIVKPLQETVVEKFVKPATETFVEKVIQPATETIVKKYVQEQPAKYTEYTIVNGEKVPVSEYTIVNGEKVPSKVSEYSILNGDKMPSKVSEYKIVNGEKMPINTEENKPVMESSQ